MPDPTDHRLTDPPSLRAFLDAGGDPATVEEVWLDGLAGVAFREVRLLPAQARATKAADYRLAAERSTVRSTRTDFLWQAEVYDDPTLAEPLAAALPAELVAEHEADWDKWRRPHPLEVRTPETWWTCQCCGASFDEGEAVAVVIGERPGHSDGVLDYPIRYCADCVALVAEILGHARAETTARYLEDGRP